MTETATGIRRSSYERELLEQPAALRLLSRSDLPPELAGIRLVTYPRIVVTGMGSSHFAAIPLWRALVRAGFPAWWLSTSELLDSPGLVTSESLVIMTSQSGRSGEVVAAVQGAVTRPRTLIAVTNDRHSPLAEAAAVCLELRSGAELTVSAKSYLNTLATHHRLAVALTGGDPAKAVDEVLVAADDLAAFDCDAVLATVARKTTGSANPRVALVGKGDEGATALFGGLITKEAAKVAAEGYVGGEFRHGPLEIAGPGLTAVIFAGARAGEPAADPSLAALAVELVAAGSETVLVGGTAEPGVTHIGLPARNRLSVLVLGAKVAQVLSVELARAGGRVPGEFLFGQKITSTL